MNWINVADTAIKIGLGALIGGVFALLSSQRQHTHELERERLKRRERVLEKTVEDFELAYQALSAKYTRAHSLAVVVTGEKYRINAHDCIHSRATDDLARLHVVESHLFLLGLKKEAATVMRFRQIAGEFEQLALPKDRSHPNPQTLNLKLEELFQQRATIYDCLAEYYDDPGKKGLNF